MKRRIVIAGALLIACASGQIVEIIPEGTDALRNPCAYGETPIADLTKMAEDGNADAQFALASRYYDGDGVAEDRAAAFNWFKVAAEQGHVKSQCCLGVMYEGAGGVVSNFVEAAKWYRKAAEQGYAEGQRRFGALRRGGMGVEKNVEEGLEWCRKAAMQGDVYAAHDLGDSYRFGYDVKPDMEESLKWYRVAAENGDPIAKSYCGNPNGGSDDSRTLLSCLGLLLAWIVCPFWWMFACCSLLFAA